MSGGKWGASPAEWDYMAHLGLTEDLLPVVSNPHAKISAQSKLKGLGKTPSRYNAEGEVVGIGKWTDVEATPNQVKAWSKVADYGICIQTRRVRALDIDIPEEDEAAKVEALFLRLIGKPLPKRYRANSGKRLLAFVLPGDLGKRSFKTRTGLVEFLATGQQFVAVGTHTSGARYEWDTVTEMPELEALTHEDFEAAWSGLVAAFAVETPRRSERRGGGGASAAGVGQDEVAAWLSDNYEAYDLVDGKLFVACPWKEGHSGDSGETEAAWLLAGTGGYQQGHFECLHASCAGREDREFLDAVGYSASLFEDISTAEERELAAQYVAHATASASPHNPSSVGQAVKAKLPLPGFKRNSSGVIEPTLENTVKALKHPEACGCRIAFDEFRAELMVAPPGTDDWRPMTDGHQTHLRIELERIGFKAVGKELMRDALSKVMDDVTFDSARLWASRLPAWDGVPRVAGFMTGYMGWADTPYSAAVGLYAWTAMAGRVMEPGVKVDMVPILVGEQGMRKSSGIIALAPAEEFYAEFDLHEDDANLARLMRGCLVGELGELRGLNSREVESIKAWIVRRWEKWTPKFKEYAATFSRRLLFWGTTNEDEFLGDGTGERRWLPGRCERLVDVEAIERDRDQLWAEGLALFGEGGVLWQEAERLARFEHGQFQVHDAWEGPVQRWLHEPDIAGDKPADLPHLLVADVLTDALHLPARQQTKREEMRVGRVLRALGYTRKMLRADGRRTWFWVKD